MLSKTDINLLKYLGSVFVLGCIYSSSVFAQGLNCTNNNDPALKAICSAKFSKELNLFKESTLTTNLVTDAPLRLIQDTEKLWLQQLKQCKSFNCYKQQFDSRIEQLNFYTSMNQSLTQHYLKYENGDISSAPVHLQIHQLNKDNIKVEGIAYHNPNNKLDKQTIPFLAYSTTETKTKIINNESDCKYEFNYTKAYLMVKTEQKNCDRFSGVYRLYD